MHYSRAAGRRGSGDRLAVRCEEDARVSAVVRVTVFAHDAVAVQVGNRPREAKPFVKPQSWFVVRRYTDPDLPVPALERGSGRSDEERSPDSPDPVAARRPRRR